MSRYRDALRALGDCARLAREWIPGPIDPRQVAICTIHGNSPGYCGDFAARYAWPRLQIERLRRHTPAGYTVLAYGNRAMPEHEAYLRGCPEVRYLSSAETPWGTYEHVWPLRNWLARIAMQDHRWIVHLDSDAFPVRDDWLQLTLARIGYGSPVVAVQRIENGDRHSDRCFLVYSRAGFRRHAFDFSRVGRVDSGGGISAELEAGRFAWHPMRRSNAHDYHPLIGGIYGDLIYHHGAGSREPRFRMNAGLWDAATHWRREQATHRILMGRLFDRSDDFLAELRGERPPFDLAGELERELAGNPTDLGERPEPTR
jgi:hypothetical protein